MTETVPLEERWRGRFDRIVPTVFLVAFAFVQKPGWLAADTKLDLLVDPGGFLGRALSLWDPLAAGGQLQNQAYGYLFPMGPFFWLGSLLHLPAWVVQRLWWVLVLLLAYHGTLRVLERLGIGTGWSRIIGALAYALAPRMLIGLGAISSEIWPMALAPWILLPLLAVAPGRERSAALRSGVAVLALGAVNAVASAAVLVLPLWWILTRRGRVRWRLLGWWSVAVALATAWWVGPLLLLGRFSPPFLDWIEDARVTTSVASVTDSLRGTTQWIAAIGGQDNAVWPAGWVTLTSRSVILLGLLVVLVGLLGLGLARGPWVSFARGGLLAGLLLVTLGHVGGVGGPWAGLEADLLDGLLAPLRNTHKFEPVVRLALALGVAHALPLTVTWLRRLGAPWPQLVPVLVAMALVGQTAAPAFLGVLQRGPFLAVPSAWEQAAAWLGAHPDGGRSLLLPGGNAPARLWGEPKDEPLQPYASQPWVVRDAVPLGSGGATRILDEVESRVAQGRGGPQLLALFGSLGVTRVVLVADHQRVRSATTPPVVVRAALTSTGARSVARFGDLVGGSLDVTNAADWGLDRPLREVEVFDVATGSTIAPTERTPTGGTALFAGGPEGFAALPGQGPGVLAADPESAPTGQGAVVVSDTLQRRQAGFASATDLYGPLLAADQPYPAPRAIHDYWPEPLDEDDPALSSHQTVRHDDADARAEASSTLAEPALGQGRELASDAWRAFDGSGETAWRSSGFDPRGQWVEARWADPVALPPRLDVTLDVEVGTDVAALTVVTEAGAVRTPVTGARDAGNVDPSHYVVPVDVPAGGTRSLRVVVDAVRDARPTVRVLDVGAGSVPRVEPWVRLPSTGARTPDVVTIEQGMDDRPACYPMSSGVLACSPDRRRVGEEAFGLRRLFTTGESRSWTAGGTAVASGEGADVLLRRVDGVRASASSRWLPEPGVSPELTVDGDPGTYWASDPDDAAPTLTVRWPTTRHVTGLRLETDPDVAGRRPTRIEVSIAGRTVARTLDRDGVVDLPPADARRVRVRVTSTTTQRSTTSAGPRTMPVVVGEVTLVGDPWGAGADAESSVQVPCGFGPTVQVGGRTLTTAVTTTRSGVITGRDAVLRACDGRIELGSGEQRVQAVSSGEFAVRGLRLTSRSATTTAAPVPTPVRATSWNPASRTVDLGPAAPVDTLLVVRENANAGWVATAGSGTLRPVRVDGWAQAWVVPAGLTGAVELRFTPQRPFMAFLLVGAALALLLVVSAALSRSPRDSEVVPGLGWSTPGRVLAAVVPVLVGGVAGAVAALLAWGVRVAPGRWTGICVVGTAAVVWVGWAVASPWPSAAATNRDVVSGVLGLVLVAVATTWGSGRQGARRARSAVRPGQDRSLQEVPADGGDSDRGGEGQQHRHPEPVGEDVQAQQAADCEHQGEVPEEHPVADGAQIGQWGAGQDA